MSPSAPKFRQTLVLLPALALAGWAGGASAAADAHKELQTATQHAGFAAKGKSVSESHMHLHHVINCLVGPSGQGFDAQIGNPCQGEGGGLLADFSGPPEKKAMLEQALALAKVGVEINEPAPVRTTAQAARELLHDAGTTPRAK
jgi:hypothetical protein